MAAAGAEHEVGHRPARLDVTALLELTAAGPDRFLGTSFPISPVRVFGGQVLAQGLIAAARTIADTKQPHSMHAYFLRAGDPYQPIEYQVERVRDGRQLSCRQVSATQGGKPIATMICSLADTSGGPTHQRRIPPTPPPTQLPTLAEAVRPWGGISEQWAEFAALDIRVKPRLIEPGTVVPDPGGVADHVWQRVPVPMPDDPVLHQAMLLFASDITQLAASLVPHGVPLGLDELNGRGWDGVSVDHAMWFHRPARADEWLLFEQCAPSAGHGRTLTRADVFTADGELVASVAQEGLIRDIAR